MTIRYLSPPNLIAQFLTDGRVFLQDRSRGVGAKVPPWTLSVISLCTQPHSRTDIVNKLSQRGGQIFDQFIDIGILIPEHQQVSEQMFQNFASIPVHRRMLSDEIRLDMYRKALKKTVTPQSIVIDAGSGTGALAVYAALAGASKVYAIENSEMVDQIAQVAKDSGVADRIEIISGNFAQVQLPQKADILVTETFGSWALAEGAAADLKACVTHNLKPGGLLLPHTISLWAAPLTQCPKELLTPFRAREDGLNLSSLYPQAYLRSANMNIEAHGQPQKICSLSLLENTFEGTLHLERPCSALLLWFDLHFSDNLILSTSPKASPTHWKQTVIAADLATGTHKMHGRPDQADQRGLSLLINNHEYRIR